MSVPALPRLYAIADVDFCGGLAPWRTLMHRFADAALRHPGRFAIQVRGRSASEAALGEIARLGRELVDRAAPLLLNGPEPLAVKLGYDGVHWPEAAIPDEPPPAALPFRIAAVHSIAAIRRAERAGASAAVFAPVFDPTWKSAQAAGLAALREVTEATPLPVYALGGIHPERVPNCLRAGAHGVAVLSGIAGDPDPARVIARYLDPLT